MGVRGRCGKGVWWYFWGRSSFDKLRMSGGRELWEGGEWQFLGVGEFLVRGRYTVSQSAIGDDGF